MSANSLDSSGLLVPSDCDLACSQAIEPRVFASPFSRVWTCWRRVSALSIRAQYFGLVRCA